MLKLVQEIISILQPKEISKRMGWKNVSSYAQAYTTYFARSVAGAILSGRKNPEHPLMLEGLLVGLEDHERPEVAQEAIKWRRVELEQPDQNHLCTERRQHEKTSLGQLGIPLRGLATPFSRVMLGILF